MSQSKYKFKGNQADLKKYLTKDLKISPINPTHGCTGRFQLTPLDEQINGILSLPDKKGKIYYTEEYKIDLYDDDEMENNAFEIFTVDVEIID